MKKKPLSQTNPYLRDKKSYKKDLVTNVSSSTAVELGNLTPALKRSLKSAIGGSAKTSSRGRKESG